LEDEINKVFKRQTSSRKGEKSKSSKDISNSKKYILFSGGINNLLEKIIQISNRNRKEKIKKVIKNRK